MGEMLVHALFLRKFRGGGGGVDNLLVLVALKFADCISQLAGAKMLFSHYLSRIPSRWLTGLEVFGIPEPNTLIL